MTPLWTCRTFQKIQKIHHDQEVCDFVTARIGRNLDPSRICEELMDRYVNYFLVLLMEWKLENIGPVFLTDRLACRKILPRIPFKAFSGFRTCSENLYI